MSVPGELRARLSAFVIASQGQSARGTGRLQHVRLRHHRRSDRPAGRRHSGRGGHWLGRRLRFFHPPGLRALAGHARAGCPPTRAGSPSADGDRLGRWPAGGGAPLRRPGAGQRGPPLRARRRARIAAVAPPPCWAAPPRRWRPTGCSGRRCVVGWGETSAGALSAIAGPNSPRRIFVIPEGHGGRPPARRGGRRAGRGRRPGRRSIAARPRASSRRMRWSSPARRRPLRSRATRP